MSACSLMLHVAFLIQALKFIGDKRNKEAQDKMAKERELAKVAVKKEDVDLIVSTYLT